MCHIKFHKFKTLIADNKPKKLRIYAKSSDKFKVKFLRICWLCCLASSKSPRNCYLPRDSRFYLLNETKLALIKCHRLKHNTKKLSHLSNLCEFLCFVLFVEFNYESKHFMGPAAAIIARPRRWLRCVESVRVLKAFLHFSWTESLSSLVDFHHFSECDPCTTRHSRAERRFFFGEIQIIFLFHFLTTRKFSIHKQRIWAHWGANIRSKSSSEDGRAAEYFNGIFDDFSSIFFFRVDFVVFLAKEKKKCHKNFSGLFTFHLRSLMFLLLFGRVLDAEEGEAVLWEGKKN